MITTVISQVTPEKAGAAGKEGATNESELWELIQKGASSGTFVDIRPHLDIDIVEEAKRSGWKGSHTGHGMNARNRLEHLRMIDKS